MRTKVEYEWTYETLDEDGDIIDQDFSDSLDGFFKKDDERRLGLVRNEGNEHKGLTDRYWAYVENGKLPEYFEDGAEERTNIKVPAKYHNELKSYWNR